MEMETIGNYPQYNAINGRFLKGHVPHNKGKKWEEWMDMRKAKRVLRIGMKNLRKGNPDIPGWNKKKVVSVAEDGSWKLYLSATSAAEMTGLDRRNISHCCEGKRKRCGGLRWFFWESDEWLKLISNEYR